MSDNKVYRGFTPHPDLRGAFTKAPLKNPRKTFLTRVMGQMCSSLRCTFMRRRSSRASANTDGLGKMHSSLLLSFIRRRSNRASANTDWGGQTYSPLHITPTRPRVPPHSMRRIYSPSSGDHAIVVISASSALLASSLEYCTTTGSLDSSKIAYGVSNGMDSPLTERILSSLT